MLQQQQQQAGPRRLQLSDAHSDVWQRGMAVTECAAVIMFVDSSLPPAAQVSRLLWPALHCQVTAWHSCETGTMRGALSMMVSHAGPADLNRLSVLLTGALV